MRHGDEHAGHRHDYGYDIDRDAAAVADTDCAAHDLEWTLPVVGSGAGASGSFFRTGVQLHNPFDSPITATFAFRAQGAETSDPPRQTATIAPHQTIAIDDLVASMGQSGIGSGDLHTSGPGTPVVVVHVYDDGGSAGTTGFTVSPPLRSDAITANHSAVVIAPIDANRSRFNIGVRSLENGAVIAFRSGSVTVTRTYARESFEQVSARSIFGADAQGAIVVTVESGSAFIYGAQTDNITQDPSLQMAQPLP